MEVRALLGRFVWRGVNIDDVKIHPSRGSRINPPLKVWEHNRVTHASLASSAESLAPPRKFGSISTHQRRNFRWRSQITYHRYYSIVMFFTSLCIWYVGCCLCFEKFELLLEIWTVLVLLNGCLCNLDRFCLDNRRFSSHVLLHTWSTVLGLFGFL